jgi:ammonia channel protein AmtB
VHGVAGIWGKHLFAILKIALHIARISLSGVLAVGVFGDEMALASTGGRAGLLKGGGIHLLAVQALAVVCIVSWAIFSTFLLLWIVNKITPLRMRVEDEIMGADYAEHNIMQPSAIERDTASRGFRLHDDDNKKMAVATKTHFTDELMADRSKAAARENPAFQHDNA